MRDLLKALRRPHLLATVPLASALSRVYGVDDRVEAVRRFVRETFGGGGLVGDRLLELVERGDFDATLPLTSVARQMGLSVRQFFRYRSEAVRALRQRAQELAGTFPDSKSVMGKIAGVVGQTDAHAARVIYGLVETPAHDDVDRIDAAINAGKVADEDLPRESPRRLLALCRVARGAAVYGDPASAHRITEFVEQTIFGETIPERRSIEFELQWLSYVDRLYRGSVDEALDAANALLPKAQHDPAMMRRAFITQAEAALRYGDAVGARQAIAAAEHLTPPSDVRVWTVLLCCRGGIAMLEHDFALLDKCFSTAEIVVGKRKVDQWNTQTFIGRARRLTGGEWTPADAAMLVEPLQSGQIALDDGVVSLPDTTNGAPGRIALRLTFLRTRVGIKPPSALRYEMEDLLALAAARGYGDLAALAHACLAQLHSSLDNAREAKNHVVLAWEAWSAVQDRLSAVDLFAGEWIGRCRRDNPALCRSIESWARRIQPDGPFGRMATASATATIQSLLELEPAPRRDVASFDDPVVAGIAMLFSPTIRAEVAEAIRRLP